MPGLLKELGGAGALVEKTTNAQAEEFKKLRRELAGVEENAVSLDDLYPLLPQDSRDARADEFLALTARQPVRPETLAALGLEGLTVGAVCVYHDMVETAVRALEGTSIPVAARAASYSDFSRGRASIDGP